MKEGLQAYVEEHAVLMHYQVSYFGAKWYTVYVNACLLTFIILQ